MLGGLGRGDLGGLEWSSGVVGGYRFRFWVRFR